MDFRAVDYAASKQSGHQEHQEVYCSFPCIPQLGRELQPIHPETNAIRKFSMYIRVFHHFFKHFLAEPNRAYNFIAISVPQIQNFRKF